MTQLITAKELAQRLGISTNYLKLQRARKDGLPFIMQKGLCMYAVADVEVYERRWDGLLNSTQVADFLGLTAKSLSSMRRNNRLPVTTYIGRLAAYSVESVTEFQKNNVCLINKSEKTDKVKKTSDIFRINQLIGSNLTVKQIAKNVGCSVQLVHAQKRKHSEESETDKKRRLLSLWVPDKGAKADNGLGPILTAMWR